MSWNPKDEYYDETPNGIDYANPAYYQQGTAETPRSAQPVKSLDPMPSYPGDTNETSEMAGQDAVLMSPYTGPASLEGYTVDAGAEQREIAKRGSAEGSKKRKGLAGGLGGIGATIVALLIKFKTALFVLFDLKWLLPFSKIGFASITALISIGAYALFFGWPLVKKLPRKLPLPTSSR